MKIGIDISTILNHGTDIGSGRYIFNLIKNLLEIDHEDTFIFTGRYITDKYLSSIQKLNVYHNLSIESNSDSNSSNICSNGSSRVVGCSGNRDAINGDDNSSSSSRGGGGNIAREHRNKLEFKLFKTSQKKLDLWNRLRFPPIELLGFKADLLHCPDFLIPPTVNKNIVLTIHDLAFIRYPEFNFEWFIKKYTKEVTANAKNAKMILADSQSTKNDIVEFLKINPQKIEVSYLAADDIFKKITESEKDKDLLKKYRIDKKYILSVGTIEPRKNYITLIKAFNILKSKKLRGENYSIDNSKGQSVDHKLVIVGRTGWKSEATYNEFNNSPYKNDILFLGHVSDPDLIQIYNQAELFVYPSIFEGFGLPVVEAMKCGLPVLVSNSSSLVEIAPDKNFLVNPKNPEEFAEKIESILKNDELRKELSEKSQKHSEKFSWETTAREVLKTYKKITNS
jgi:glycosyltransferase involved in cell wall biosynthesis